MSTSIPSFFFSVCSIQKDCSRQRTGQLGEASVMWAPSPYLGLHSDPWGKLKCKCREWVCLGPSVSRVLEETVTPFTSEWCQRVDTSDLLRESLKKAREMKRDIQQCHHILRKGQKDQASRCLCDFTRSDFNLRQSGSDNVRLRQPCPLCCLRWALEQVCDFGLIRSSDPTSQMRKLRSKTVGTYWMEWDCLWNDEWGFREMLASMLH